MGPFRRAINDVQKTARKAGRNMQAVGTRMSTAITAPLIGVGGLALKTAADFETLRQSMDVLNGSAEEGARNFERLKEFSAGTPFQLKGLARAQNTLQGFSLSADDAFESMKMIGDIAAVTGGDMQAISVAFGQAAAEGKLMTRDIRQLINQGVPAVQLLADSMGVATDEIFDLASQGEITFEVLQKAFRDATSEGGRFADGMEKQSKTLAGVFSTLKDNATIALNEIGQSISETFDIKGIMQDVTSQIQIGIEWFNSLSKETRKAAFIMAGVLGASGPIIAALGTLSLAIGAISAPIAAAVAAVVAGSVAIVNNWEDVEDYFTSGGGAQMWKDLQGIVSESAEIITAIWDKFGDNITETAKTSFGVVIRIIEQSLSAILTIMKKFNGEFDTELNIFEDNIVTTFQKIDAIIVNSFVKTIGKAVDFLAEVSRRAYDIFLEPWVSLLPGDMSKAVADATEAARKNATSRGKDVIIPAKIDTTEPDMDLTPMKMFEGSNPINKATTSAASLGNTLNTQVIGNLKKASGEYETISDAAIDFGKESKKALTESDLAARQLASGIGNVVGQLLSGKKEALSFGDVMSAIIPGLISLIPGGGAFAGLASGIFAGMFHDGGIVPGGSKERMVRVKPGEGIFTQGQMKALGGMQGGGGKTININISGEKRITGDELRLLFNESHHIDFN